MNTTTETRAELALARLSTDELEQQLVAAEQVISCAGGYQLRLLRELDRRQVGATDAARSMIEWTEAKLDVTRETARQLVRTARSLASLPEIEKLLSAGKVGFNRTAVLCRLPQIEDDVSWVAESYRWDLAALKRQAARTRRVTRTEEQETARNQYLVCQPNLFGTGWKGWFACTPADGAVIEKALVERADQLPALPDGTREPRSARMMTALVSICQDSLDGDLPEESEPRGSAGAQLTVFLDGNLAASTGGEAGGEISAGPRIGPQLLEEILCGGRVDVVGYLQGGTLIRHGDSTQPIPPAVRRYVFWRDGGMCTVRGCRSRYRLQPHHIRPRAKRGDNHPDGLSLVCWFHHHHAIHQLGYGVAPDSRPGSIRLLPPDLNPERGPP